MNNIDSINSAGVTVKGQHVSWRELTLAATQDDAALAAAYGALLDRAISQYGAMGLGGADYHERTRVLAEVRRLRASREAAIRAEKQAAAEARAQREDAARGYHVHVVSDTSGATWRAELRRDGDPTREHVGAGEGCSYGRYAPAEAEAREIADRLRARVTARCPVCGDLHSAVTTGTLTPTDSPALCAQCQPVTDAQTDALAAWEASVRRAVAEERAAQGRATEDDRETMH